MNSTQLAQKFDQEWGAFRKFIAAHPMAGFWIGVVLGTFFACLVLKVF